jgi:hypothetical protein
MGTKLTKKQQKEIEKIKKEILEKLIKLTE